jgi:hypothetical protein
MGINVDFEGDFHKPSSGGDGYDRRQESDLLWPEMAILHGSAYRRKP